MSRQLFFDCIVCKYGKHYACLHGSHSADECKCVEEEDVEKEVIGKNHPETNVLELEKEIFGNDFVNLNSGGYDYELASGDAS